MAQLIVKDLDFCEIELSEVEGGWIDIQVDLATALEVEGNSPQFLAPALGTQVAPSTWPRH